MYGETNVNTREICRLFNRWPDSERATLVAELSLQNVYVFAGSLHARDADYDRSPRSDCSTKRSRSNNQRTGASAFGRRVSNR